MARSKAALENVVLELPLRKGQLSKICVADLADAEAPKFILHTARNFFGQLHILVNNAAIQEPIGLAWECETAAWQRSLRVNLVAPVALCQAVLPWLTAAQRGKIINLSGGGATGPRPNFSAYATAKAGLVRFSETLAAEAQPFGVDVNCIAPGAMGTDMMRAVLAAGPEKAGAREFENAQKLLAQEGRVEMPAVELAVFLASAASDGLTGKLISAVWDAWEKIPEQLEKVRQSDVFTLRRVSAVSKDWKSETRVFPRVGKR